MSQPNEILGDDSLPDLVKALRLQGSVCRNMGSPLGGELLDRAAADRLAGGPVGALLEPWRDGGLKALFDAAVPLRLLACWHELALAGDDPEISAAYASLDAAAIWAAAAKASVSHRARLMRFMEHEPQTNEVRRSIGLVGGFLEAAKATGLPLRTFEIAASAGLNLSWDRYHYRLGGATWGDPDATVRLDTDWQGGVPPVEAPVRVVERAACDRRPTDLTDETQRRRLAAYLWADQPERLERLRAAIAVALKNGVTVEAADAVDWVRARVSPERGATTVLFHSVFWQYMPAESQAALTALIAEIGARATPEAPFAWLRLEPPSSAPSLDLTLTLWPGGEARRLARANPHAASVQWLGG